VTLRQTYSQLADKYGCSAKTIQRKIDRYRLVSVVHTPRQVVVVMDTTYRGRDFGVMLFKDALTGEDQLWYFVKRRPWPCTSWG
jgi:predicted DNA-binding transcriptional regulator YafY